ncbi:uncharacterized protein N7484_005210 [Penicillium longicatenatum]|uniref:uncharacterized protein n=1 Tax=Penicillium longicatenatum TaxID=1561947 RepID=UPI002549718A|nr:uncharacterized protein N7484_005210 [Penicillium longicatenatum]KAJ5651487.1 hypothetical protein N7484_005210 [Penicillium longicatenatum]
MCINLLQLVLGAFMLLSVASSINPIFEDVTPAGSSAGSTTSSIPRSTTTNTKYFTQKGVGALTTADLTQDVIVMLGRAAFTAMAL